MVLNEKDKLITAIHIAGHAVTSIMRDSSNKVNKITILPRGQ